MVEIRYQEEIGWYSSYFRYFGLEGNFDRKVKVIVIGVFSLYNEIIFKNFSHGNI